MFQIYVVIIYVVPERIDDLEEFAQVAAARNNSTRVSQNEKKRKDVVQKHITNF